MQSAPWTVQGPVDAFGCFRSRAHGVAAIREIGKTGGFEDFEIQTGPSKVTSVSGQVVLHASCTSESSTRMYNQLIICLQILKCKKLFSSVRYMWFLVLEAQKSLLCRRRDPASLREESNVTPCSAPRPVQKQNSESPDPEMPRHGMRPWTIVTSAAALI